MAGLSLKDKIAARIAAKKSAAAPAATAKKTVTKPTPAAKAKEAPKTVAKKTVGKKAAPAPVKKATTGKGRPAGVRYTVPDSYQEQINVQFSEIETNFKALEQNLNKFIDQGNKSAAKAARTALMSLIKVSKPLRKMLQDAKMNMEQEAA